MGLKDKLKRLERVAEGGFVGIPQPDGSVKRFPQSAMREAFLNECKRLRGEDLPLHPFTIAASNSPAPEWNRSGFAEMSIVGDDPIEDLSEK